MDNSSNSVVSKVILGIVVFNDSGAYCGIWVIVGGRPCILRKSRIWFRQN